VIKESNLSWLKELPVFQEVEGVNMVHGGWNNPIDEYLYDIELDYFDTIEGQYFASGHTHVQSILDFNGKVYCNPGSVGQPRDFNPLSAYAIFEDGKFELNRVGYDMEKVFDLMDKAGFNDYYYGCLKTGARYLKQLD
jgi:diadenosine tetraphosphatase ApaH/serine/threonine PP2A family protein phosphatase